MTERFPRPSRVSVWRRVFHQVAVMAVALLASWTSGAFTPFAPGVSAERIVNLTGESFLRAVEKAVPSDNETRLTLPELIEILKRFPTDQFAKSDAESCWECAFLNVYGAACRLAGPEHVDQLVAIVAGCPRENVARHVLLAMIARPWIQRELQAIETEHPPALTIVPTDDELPDHLQTAPVELQAVWRETHALLSRFRAFRDYSEEEKISSEVDYPEFERLIDQVLSGNGQNISSRLRLYKSDSKCGTCQEVTAAPRDLAIFMDLLRERRIQEAVGAALFVRSSQMVEPVDGDLRIRQQFWQLYGIDWESLVIGVVLDDTRYGWADTYHLFDLLGRHGSAEGARLFGLALSVFDRDRTKTNAEYALELFLTQPEAEGEPRADALELRDRKRREPLPDAAQRELVQALVRTIQDTKDSDYSESLALRMLDGVKRKDFAALLRPLLGHRSEEVAEIAAKTLRSLGEEVP